MKQISKYARPGKLRLLGKVIVSFLATVSRYNHDFRAGIPTGEVVVLSGCEGVGGSRKEGKKKKKRKRKGIISYY